MTHASVIRQDRHFPFMMKYLSVFVFGLLLSASAAAQGANGRVALAGFRSDNCTFFPNGNYADCCVAHDKDYYFGGSLRERRASDKRLRECVISKGKGWKRKFLANGMYLAVRIAGVSFLPTPFRWGFGNKWPRKSPETSKVGDATNTTDP